LAASSATEESGLACWEAQPMLRLVVLSIVLVVATGIILNM
jgi:hypothetical protein